MKKLLFLINPKTAKPVINPYAIDIIDIFIKGGYEVTVHVTQNRNDTENTARSVGENYDIIVCAGGDGTLNGTVSGIFNLKNKPKVGYIPAGTTNDFAASWGIPKNPVDAARSIITTEPVKTDISTFCGKPFVYVAAFGAFTEVSYQTPQQLKNSLGRTAYLFEGIKSLPSIKPIRMNIEYDGGLVCGSFAYGMISNTKRVGGFDLKMKDDISISDGLMEMILVKFPDNPVDNPKMIGAVLSQDISSQYVTFVHTTRVKFESDEAIPWSVDGEKGGNVRTGEAEIEKHAIELFF